jgi:hypothetical protein
MNSMEVKDMLEVAGGIKVGGGSGKEGKMGADVAGKEGGGKS